MSVDFEKVLTKVFGTSNERIIKRLTPLVTGITAFEAEVQKLTDEELRAKTFEFRARMAKRIEGLTDAEEISKAEREALDELLPEAFAVVREAGWRTVHMRHFDVQLIGGMVLHQGKIAEMKTGEGKTLVATLSCYLNALAGHGVHVVTVNDYLAKRDAEWMGKIYDFLGLTVGVIVHDLDDNERRAAYAADITYGTNNEFGFDYLRDNMKFEIKDCVQRGHYYAIVDEVDSILIDEARTPLIISGPTDQTTDKYARVRKIIPQLVKGEEIEEGETKYLTGDYIVDEKQRTIGVTDEGWVTIEKLLGIGNIADAENWDLKHYVETGDQGACALQARRGVRGEGRRGHHRGHLHRPPDAGPALERRAAPVHRGQGRREHPQGRPDAGHHHLPELLPPLQEAERHDRHGGDRSGRVREDLQAGDRRDSHQQAAAARWRIPTWSTAPRRKSTRRWPTTSPSCTRRSSRCWWAPRRSRSRERLSAILQRKGVRHVVLNAKFHEREAEIVAQAGRLGMVTIATNMAGRGTDILLGGNPEFMARQELVKKGKARAISVAEGAINPMAPAGFLRFYYQGQEFEIAEPEWAEIFKVHAETAQQEHEQVIAAGGLFILGTERHESRRIDNQLRGRAGRQGDPGESRFYLSLEDDLMRIFAKQWVSHAAGAAGHGRRRAHRVEDDLQAHRGRAEGSRSAELRVAQAPARVRRRDEQAARGRLRPAPPAAGGRRPAGTDSGGLRRRNSERHSG